MTETKTSEYQEQIHFSDSHVVRALSGNEHEKLRCIAKVFKIRVGARGEHVNLIGPKAAVKKASSLLKNLGERVTLGQDISLEDVRNAAMRMSKEKNAKPADFLTDHLLKTKNEREVRPRGPGQRLYVEAINRDDLVFGVGPAGTGKTYLAMTLAVMALKAERIARIILTRPAVEAGEKLGFLPGNLEEKVSPYLRPLYDALFDLVGTEKAEELVAHGLIEVAPLAFMRGRTLNDAFVILDEAQNTTPEQMKMALTRLGFGSKMVVTGDITQIDLPAGQRSGLIEATNLLQNIPGVSICKLSEKDVVRHPLVQLIIKAYDE
jgi:phosphate starvation-inducible protein PhoH and related proteins